MSSAANSSAVGASSGVITRLILVEMSLFIFRASCLFQIWGCKLGTELLRSVARLNLADPDRAESGNAADHASKHAVDVGLRFEIGRSFVRKCRSAAFGGPIKKEQFRKWKVIGKWKVTVKCELRANEFCAYLPVPC